MTPTNSAPLSQTPIPLEPYEGGALNWFDHMDADHRVLIELPGDCSESVRGERGRETRLVKALRETSHQGFFFQTLAHKGMALDHRLVSSRPCVWPDRWHNCFSVPLAELFLLPNQNPAQELAQIKAFLTWVDQQRQGKGPGGREANIQWFRGGYRERGLEWAYVEDREVARNLNAELQGWRKQAWFEQWFRANLQGLAKTRMGPHCWFPMGSLVRDRQIEALVARRKMRP